MPTHDKPTGDNALDNAHSSRPDAQQKSGSGIKAKVSGAGNVIHGTGEVIRGVALDIGDFGHGHGNGKAIIAAGREKVERGLNKIEGKPIATSAADHAPHQGGVGDGIGAAPTLDPNTPQTSTAAPTAQRVRGDVADTGHPADRGTASAAANDTHGRMPEPHHYGQTAVTPLPRDRPTTTDDPGVQRDTDVRQQGNMIVSGDRGKETRTTAAANGSHGRTPEQHPYEQAPVTALPRDHPTAADDPGIQRDTDVRQQGNMIASSARDKDTRTTAAANGGHGRTPEQHHSEQTPVAALSRDRPTAVDDPGVQRDTDVRQQGNTIASNDRDKEARTTADSSYTANAAGQEQPFGTVL